MPATLYYSSAYAVDNFFEMMVNSVVHKKYKMDGEDEGSIYHTWDENVMVVEERKTRDCNF